MLISTDVSVADLLDRISICEIKLEHINDDAKRKNIQTELEVLKSRLKTLELPRSVLDLVAPLRTWNEENFVQLERVLACEAANDFGERYVEAARAAFYANAQRAGVKRQINVLLDSEIIEEKSF